MITPKLEASQKFLGRIFEEKMDAGTAASGCMREIGKWRQRILDMHYSGTGEDSLREGLLQKWMPTVEAAGKTLEKLLEEKNQLAKSMEVAQQKAAEPLDTNDVSEIHGLEDDLNQVRGACMDALQGLESAYGMLEMMGEHVAA